MQKVLPDWLSELSISRSQIILDQLRNAIAEQLDSSRKTQPTLIWMASTPTGGDNGSTIAVAAIHGREGTERRLSDSVTILHAGSICNSFAQNISALPKQDLATEEPNAADQYFEIETQLVEQGLKFAFWATDAADIFDCPSEDDHTIRDSTSKTDESATASRHCEDNPTEIGEPLSAANGRIASRCRLFGFEPLATLEYLSHSLESRPTNADETAAVPKLALKPVDFADESTSSDFAALVQETYQGTLDCPRLNDFRTAAQSLAGYQAADSFAAERWYAIHADNEDSEDPDAAPIGCLILASHGDTTTELVYMALIPRARGRGYGQPLIQAAITKAVEWGSREMSSSKEATKAAKLVLAVDEANNIARTLYHRAGFEPILRETVWGKQLAGSTSP